MSRRLTRRLFLRASALAGGALAVSPLRALAAMAERVERTGEPTPWLAPDNAGYGPLQKAGPELDLPQGFVYVRFGAAGTPMSDGQPTPEAHDGMFAYNGPHGTVRLVRNHEVSGRRRAFGPDPYDGRAGGGTVNLVFDPVAGRLLASHPSLTGTVRNCAGGNTGRYSWISCEETTVGLDDGFTEPHGYCFEVPANATGPVPAVPLKAMGRFVHEAVCVDRHTGDVFLTEDQGTAGFYRFRPWKRHDLQAGGRLQMLAVRDRPGYDTRRGQRRGRSLAVRWVDIPDPDPQSAGRNPLAVFQQGLAQGGAVFARLEGCWWHQNQAVFVSTSGGDNEVGQMWAYRPADDSLVLVFESPSAGLLSQPDNVTSTPRGSLLWCEDSPGPDRMRGLDPEGRVFNFARNRFSDGEFCGATFSKDGQVLFVNVQRPGVTFAITGPWGRGPI